MNAEERSKKATALFEEGYNCSQAVVLAFDDMLPVERDVLARIASSFGGGIGRLREVCGCVSGMAAVVGALYGFSGAETGDAKAEHYALVRRLADEFRAESGSIICRELLGGAASGGTPAPRTPQFYAERPCAVLVARAAAITQRYIDEREAKK